MISPLIGVVVPFLLILLANTITAKYQKQQDELRYQAEFKKFAAGIMEEVKKLTPPTKDC